MDNKNLTYFLNQLSEKEKAYYEYILTIKNKSEDLNIAINNQKLDLMFIKLICYIYNIAIKKCYLSYKINTSLGIIEPIDELEKTISIYNKIKAIDYECLHILNQNLKLCKKNSLNNDINEILAKIYLYFTILLYLRNQRFNACNNQLEVLNSIYNGYSLQMPSYDMDQNNENVNIIYHYCKNLKTDFM